MKNKILIPLLIVGILAAFFSFTYSNGNERSSEEKRKLVIQAIMKAVDEAHYSPKVLDDTFSARVYHKLVTEMDYQKLFFTRQDMAKLGAYEFKIDDEIRDNSLEFFDTLDAIHTRRVDAGEKFYKEILDKPFTFNTNEEIQLNPDKEDYADGEAALAERWRENLKYNVLEKYVDLKKEQDKKKDNKDSVNAVIKTDAELEAQAREDTRKIFDRYFKRLHKTKDDMWFREYANAISLTEDPHTEYFPPVEKTGFDEMMSGSFSGIGAQLSPANDKVTVSTIITGSPSWKEGELKAGDEIKKVAQGSAPPVDITGMELDDVVKLIRGPNGTEVRLTVKKTDGTTKVIPIKRGIVEYESTFAKSAIINSKDGPIGYIRLPEFYADFNHTSGRNCYTDVAKEVQKLKDAGVAGIILDLRDNGGGSLGDVVDMAGLFVGKGPVVQVKGSHSAPSRLTPQVDSVLYNGPMAIMVNGGSASASEIMAAAMQDYKRAIIVGSMTYGKGTVQKMVDLDQFINPMARMQLQNDTEGAEGKSIGALKLTMEKFYRVNGGSTQLKGVTPDVEIPDLYDSYDDDDDPSERHNRSALPWDEIPAANYKQTNSVGDLKRIVSMSERRVNSSPTFQSIEEHNEYLKKMRDDNVVPLNEEKYVKYEDDITAMSKKQEELMKKITPMDMTNPPADMARINEDSASITKNKDWLKSVSKDIYVSETVNIINDMPKTAMKLTEKQE